MFNFFRRKSDPVYENTPDYSVLCDAPGWLFFEYGELKKQFPTHKDVLSLPTRQHGYTVHKCPLWMWNDNYDAFPIAMNIPTNHPVRRSRVHGELYMVPTMRIPDLDNYRLNGVQFNRKTVSVYLPNQEVIRAFAYEGNRKHWEDKFQWSQEFYRGRENSSISLISPNSNNNWLGPYTDFTQKHLEKKDTRCFIGLLHGAAEERAA